jgi:hypothetical protein
VVAEVVRGVSRPVLLVLIIFVLFGLGVLLWWPPHALPDRSSDLGTALIGGGVVALVVLVLERSFAKEAERRDLLLQVGLVDELRGINLNGRDLSGFLLTGKTLSHARFRRASLRGANLSGARLDYADLCEADLRDAKMDATGLMPSDTLFPSEDLFPGPIFPDANLQAVGLKGAAYNSRTRWPQNFGPDTLDKAGAERVDEFNKLATWWWHHRIRTPQT